MQEPTQIEKQYAIEAAKAADFGENWLVTANRALSIQNIAYQSACGNNEANAEPVAIKKHYPNIHMLNMNDGGYKCIEELKPIEPETLLYTSPQALTPITADDIQLMAFNDCSDDWNDPKYRKIWLEGYVSGAHAAIAEVKHRGEAR